MDLTHDSTLCQILTFDHHGVSGHLNHRSIPKGIIQLLTSTTFRPLPRLYTLISVPLPIKFTGLLAPTCAKLEGNAFNVIENIFAFLKLPSPQLHRKLIGRPIFISGVNDFLTTLSAIRQHKSQLVWFRWLYATFSQYMWVNQWAEIMF